MRSPSIPSTSFRKKPVVIDAMRWDGENIKAMADFIGRTSPLSNVADMTHFREVHLQTLEGPMVARVGDWIIRGVKGELYPCKPDIFAATYEAVDM